MLKCTAGLRLFAGVLIVLLSDRALRAQIAVRPATYDEVVRIYTGTSVAGSDASMSEVIFFGPYHDGPNGVISGGAKTSPGAPSISGDSAGRVAATLTSQGLAGEADAGASITWSLSVIPLASGIPANLTAPVTLRGSGNGRLSTGKPNPANPLFSLYGRAGVGVGVSGNLPGFVPYAEGAALQTLTSETEKTLEPTFGFVRTVQFPQNAEFRFAKTVQVSTTGEAYAGGIFDPEFFIDPIATFELNGQTTRFADAFRLIASDNLSDPLRRPMFDSFETWRFLDNGSNQGTRWRAVDFDDAAWTQANAQFGFGDGDEWTTIVFGADPAQKQVTTYFRKEFQTDLSQEQLASLELDLIRDGGVALYLNGVEIYRDNLPAEALFDTPAIAEIDGANEFMPVLLTIDAAMIPEGIWRQGRNVLAAEVHLSSLDDADMSFDLALTARTIPEPESGMLALIAALVLLLFCQCRRSREVNAKIICNDQTAAKISQLS